MPISKNSVYLSLSQYTYGLFVFALIFGVIFYDIIQHSTGFSYTDELLALALFGGYAYRVSKIGKCATELIIFFFIALFYLLYSLHLHSNVTAAIWTDFFIEIKPFIAFFVTYRLAFSFTKQQKKIIRILCVVLSLLLLPGAVLFGSESSETSQIIILSHSRLATGSIILGMLYLYCSNRNRRNIGISCIIMGIGLFSTRSKFFVFYSFFVGLLFLFPKIKIKISIKSFIILVFVLCISIFFGLEKFKFYFIQGSSNTEHMFARPALYLGSWNILNDYIPFGSGLGSFANQASITFLSPLYKEYTPFSLELMNDGQFGADTFFPVLAQFGYIGIALFIWFWIRVWKKAKLNYLETNDLISFKMIFLIIVFFIVESSADSTFLHNRGMFMMMLMALLLKSKTSIYEEKKTEIK